MGQLQLIGRRVDAAAVPIMLVAVPALALADRVLLGRISVAGPGVQWTAAVAEPVALTAAVVLAGQVSFGFRRPAWW